jgi:hypothetical protein
MSYREPREPSEMPEFYDPEYYKGKAKLALARALETADDDHDWLWMSNQKEQGE